MKKSSLYLSAVIIISIYACNSKKHTGENSQVVTEFLEDISSLENVESKNPIVSFKEGAEESADEIISISNDNLEDVLEKAKEARHCVITVGNHTIVKIKDINDCKKSTSWDTCMPLAEGYIKKGELSHEEGYMNNIIGVPDSQERTAFLFN